MTFDVVVVGSVNLDLTVSTPRHPLPGETVLGMEHSWGGGGKGANQAVAAARLGSRTAFVGRVGEDQAGQALIDALQAEGIDVSCVSVDSHLPTGLALITVDGQAENTIVVSPGANMSLSPGQVDECTSLLDQAAVVLAQLEIPMETVVEAARATSKLFCLNPAPAREVPPRFLELIDVLIPNRGELGTLASMDPPQSRHDVVEAVRRLEGPKAVVVTLGRQGAMVIRGDEVTELPSIPVEPVDTTGAGDAFCGALADGLARGEDLVEAASWATLAGSLATTKRGARDAMPRRVEMEQYS